MNRPPRRGEGRIRRVLLAGVALASLAVASVSLRYFFAPAQAPLLGEREGLARAALLVHAAGGVVALAAGPFQFSARLRRRAMRWHRGLGFIYLAALAWRAVCRRGLAAHREWMLRSFALTIAAVTLRLWLPLLQAGGAGFAEAYQTVAWLCWVPNLIVAESWIAATRAAPPREAGLGPRLAP